MNAIQPLKGNYTTRCLEEIAHTTETTARTVVYLAKNHHYAEAVTAETRFNNYIHDVMHPGDVSYMRSFYNNVKRDL
jgi:bifunctional ADP-heptose synthase (sugar kinase/adenylyltransferase)